jgi:pyridoxamine 5'-phosphate oxidase
MLPSELLPPTLPQDPLPIFGSWLREAWDRQVQPNPDSMILATTDAQGQPSARVVLCKRVELDEGYIVFFTNYQSRKGRELTAQPRAAAVFHWDVLHRQVRIEGQVVRSPIEESDRYFASRALDSRIGAWASEQSAPLSSRAILEQKVREIATRFAIEPGMKEAKVPRPSHWGGFRIWIDAIELWCEGANRVHDRALWTRTLQVRDEHSFTPGEWQATRLYP